MIYSKRGRPPKEYGDKKDLITSVRLKPEDAVTLRTLAHNSGISVYKYVERLVLDRLEEYRDEYDYDNEPYLSPEDFDEMTDEEKEELGYFM